MAGMQSRLSFVRRTAHRLLVLMGAAATTIAFFFVLPLMQSIANPPKEGLIVQTFDTGEIPPPPPPLEQEPEEPPKPDEKPPELDEAPPLRDLSDMEIDLNPGGAGGWGVGDYVPPINPFGGKGPADEIVNWNDLDQEPRVIYQPNPNIDQKLRKKGGGKVYIIFIVDKRGRVENPLVQKSSDADFNAPALAAVKQWKFEPGKQNGEPVRFRMRVPITFPGEQKP